MQASLDTNVIIHLYNADFQDIVFNRFDKIKVHQFIRDHEMKNHAVVEIINLFDNDVKAGRIELITDKYIKNIGMYSVFQELKFFVKRFWSKPYREVERK